MTLDVGDSTVFGVGTIMAETEKFAEGAELV